MRLRWLSLLGMPITPVVAQQTKAIEQSVGIIGLFFLAVLGYLAIAGWVALVTALAADWTRQKLHVVRQRHFTAFVLGIFITLVLVIIATLFGQVSKAAPPAGIIAVLCLLALLTLWLVGWVAVVSFIGERILSVGATLDAAPARNSLVTALVGALVLFLTAFLPIVGWAVVLYFAFVAVGL